MKAKLSVAEKVFNVICKLIDKKKDFTMVKVSQLAKCHYESARIATKKLIAIKYLKVDKKGKIISHI